MDSLDAVPSPFLALDRGVFARNCEIMRKRAIKANVRLRPHVKTHKTVEGALLQTGGIKSGIVVSTLAEARFFCDAGFDDILYAVPFGADKSASVKKLLEKLSTLHLLVDNAHQLACIESLAKDTDRTLSVWIKVDCGYHRAGQEPDSDAALSIAKLIHESNELVLGGIYTHGGQSYHAKGPNEIKPVSDLEVKSLDMFMERLIKDGISCPSVAFGSTPTCSVLPTLESTHANEMHPGNYACYDTMQRDIGSCKASDIAVAVGTRIIGVYPKRNEILIDAGWTALASQGEDHGYGDIVDHPELEVRAMSQETSVIRSKTGEALDFSKLSLGTLLYFLPYHSCAVCALHLQFYVHEGDFEAITAVWTPCRGWR